MEDAAGQYSFLFCDLCGNLLSLKSPKHAKCLLCGFKRSAKVCAGREIHYTVTAEDFRRELNTLEPFIELDGTMNVKIEMQKKVSNILCTECKDSGRKDIHYEYFEMQIRSADEGSTVFYECPECGHSYNTNN
ncbi:Dna-directed rna polymerase subunit [Thalictrum thalictroides]|uniref:DNA-directed RNA polymerase subunit n=1 Tax=Thalictrum thalictroides TaxID=46969 RepID=A0A7J6V6M6_THATH|nr:Dna-directed rna polymerase subunit [Thalictrum thalictroides]